jgi:hypothetical protein
VERRVGLKGHQFDLDDLVDGFPAGDPRVVRDDGNYFLVSEEFTRFGDNHVGLITRAREILTQMDGATLVVSSSHQPVEVDGSIYDPGGRKHAVVAAGTAEARARVSAVAVVVGGSENPREPALPAAQVAFQTAAKSPSAEAVLRLLGQGPLDWTNLYRILDYVAHERGGKDGIVQAKLATADEIDRFGASANRIEVSGDEARHGPLKGDPPTRTMTLDEGRGFIRRVAQSWLETL